MTRSICGGDASRIRFDDGETVGELQLVLELVQDLDGVQEVFFRRGALGSGPAGARLRLRTALNDANGIRDDIRTALADGGWYRIDLGARTVAAAWIQSDNRFHSIVELLASDTHLNYLDQRGEIVSAEDEDGAMRYRLA